MENKRCGDHPQPGVWYAISRFFEHGLIKGIAIAIIIGIITTLAAAVWWMPVKFAQTEALANLAALQKNDAQRLDDKKLDRAEFEIRHAELKQQVTFDMADVKQMNKELYSYILGKEYHRKVK